MASRAIPIALALALFGCARAPSPLSPTLEGSIGVPHRGVLTQGIIPKSGESFRWLRDNDRHYATARFAHAIERAASTVALARPGGMLVVGDLSIKGGGQLMPHLSHRTGRDADLLLYVTTLEGAPVQSPGFIHVGADGLAWDEARHRFLRFDVERQWLLVKTLLEDPEARIQWVFVSRVVEAILIEWARARGEPGETILRAAEVMLQPQPGGIHDDHVHIRTACSADELARGCEHTGPMRAWLTVPMALEGAMPTDEELVLSLLRPIEKQNVEQAAGPGTVSSR